MARKPDYFEQMVERVSQKNLHENQGAWDWTDANIAMLLRRYHAKVRRMVKALESSKKVPQPWDTYHEGYYGGFHDAANMFLILLDRLKKGKS